MGFRAPIDYDFIQNQLATARIELNSPYNDGYVQWSIKQNLYKIKWVVDGILNDSSTFAGEDLFLKEHEQVKMWHTLKK